MLQVVQDVTADAPASPAVSSFMHFTGWLASQFAQDIKHSHSAPQSQHYTQHQAPSVPLSADFHFGALLLQPLLSVMQASDTVTDTAGHIVDGHRQHAQSDAVQSSTDRKHSRKAQKRGKRGSHQSKETSAKPLPWSTAACGAASLVGSCPLSSAKFAMPLEQL